MSPPPLAPKRLLWHHPAFVATTGNSVAAAKVAAAQPTIVALLELPLISPLSPVPPPPHQVRMASDSSMSFRRRRGLPTSLVPHEGGGDSRVPPDSRKCPAVNHWDSGYTPEPATAPATATHALPGAGAAPAVVAAAGDDGAGGAMEDDAGAVAAAPPVPAPAYRPIVIRWRGRGWANAHLGRIDVDRTRRPSPRSPRSRRVSGARSSACPRCSEPPESVFLKTLRRLEIAVLAPGAE